MSPEWGDGMQQFCDDCDIINEISSHKLSEEDCISLIEIATENLAQYNKQLEWKIK